MASSALELIRELDRQTRTGDNKFVKRLLYFFELKVPSSIAEKTAGNTSFIFPLILPPKSYSLSEPFAVERTFTQGGGLYIEEHGILERTISLKGNTGFKPRKLFRQPLALKVAKPETKSYSRVLDYAIYDKLSGHKHFQYLQDVVFRTYADLKRDPATSEDTKLLFHNPKDDEAWHVAPRSFVLDRSSDSPIIYTYNIELLVLGPAELADATFSEDFNLLRAIKDTIQQIKNAIAILSGIVSDLTAIVSELEGLVKGIISILDTVRGIYEAATDFVNGVTDLIASPYAAIGAVQDLIDSGLEFLDSVENFPDAVRNKIRQLSEGLDILGAHPEVFAEATAIRARDNKAGQELNTSSSTKAREDAAATPAPSSLSSYNTLGTAMTPGEVTAGNGETTVGRENPEYTGSQEYEVADGDTLISLASRYLGDARLWQNIAILNGLKPPFVNWQASANLTDLNTSPFPGAIGVGSKILIPNYSKPPESQPLLPILGVKREAPTEEHLLGADLALTATTNKSGRTTYDITVDKDGGSVDAKLIRGIPNLVQGLKTRMVVEQGTDVLYRRLGTAPIVALNLRAVDIELAKFRILESLMLDPRVSSVRALDFEISEASPDFVEVEADVEIRGFAQTSSIKHVLVPA